VDRQVLVPGATVRGQDHLALIAVVSSPLRWTTAPPEKAGAPPTLDATGKWTRGRLHEARASL